MQIMCGWGSLTGCSNVVSVVTQVKLMQSMLQKQDSRSCLWKAGRLQVKETGGASEPTKQTANLATVTTTRQPRLAKATGQPDSNSLRRTFLQKHRKALTQRQREASKRYIKIAMVHKKGVTRKGKQDIGKLLIYGNTTLEIAKKLNVHHRRNKGIENHDKIRRR